MREVYLKEVQLIARRVVKTSLRYDANKNIILQDTIKRHPLLRKQDGQLFILKHSSNAYYAVFNCLMAPVSCVEDRAQERAYWAFYEDVLRVVEGVETKKNIVRKEENNK